jgi:hypothetical protein
MNDEFTPNTIPTDSAVSVAANTVTELLPILGNGKRALFIITNGAAVGSGIIIYIGIEKDANTNSGIVLYPGGVYQEAVDSYFMPTNGRITCYASAATTVYIHSRVRSS